MSYSLFLFYFFVLFCFTILLLEPEDFYERLLQLREDTSVGLIVSVDFVEQHPPPLQIFVDFAERPPPPHLPLDSTDFDKSWPAAPPRSPRLLLTCVLLWCDQNPRRANCTLKLEHRLYVVYCSVSCPKIDFSIHN